MSLAMAEIAYRDGIRGMACTPHIMPGIYDNDAAGINTAVIQLQAELDRRGNPLRLFAGADVHVAPDLANRIRSGQVPTLAHSRYFLFEPSHHVVTPRIEELATRLIAAGFVPIITHPERLSWISNHYDTFVRLNEGGCLVQVTAGSVTGDFGKYAQFYAERLMDEGRVDIIASDAHNRLNRPPIMSRARDMIAARLGDDEAQEIVLWRPARILANKRLDPVGVSRNPVSAGPESNRSESERSSFLRRLLKVTRHDS